MCVSRKSSGHGSLVIAYNDRNRFLGQNMKKISEKLEIPPDVIDGATIVNVYGNQSALVENYRSIIEYSPNQIKLQGKHVKLMFEGERLEIDRFTPEDCKIRGNIQMVHYIQT